MCTEPGDQARGTPSSGPNLGDVINFNFKSFAHGSRTGTKVLSALLRLNQILNISHHNLQLFIAYYELALKRETYLPVKLWMSY